MRNMKKRTNDSFESYGDGVEMYDENVEEEDDLTLWEEKLNDLINYALLLKALIVERHGE